jgi:hypothetical protein
MRANDKLRVYWGKLEKDLMFFSPLGFGTKSDAHWLSGVFTKEFTAELETRGYDPKTLKFSVEPLAGNLKFSSERLEGMTSDEAWNLLTERQESEERKA